MAEPVRTGRITADLYIGKSTLLKSFLLGGVVVISTVFIWYSMTVITRLKADTRSQVEKYVKLWQLAANSPNSGTEEMQFIFDEIIVKATFPIIVVDSNREPLHWRNISGVPSDSGEVTMSYLRKMVARLRADGREFPIIFGETSINYLYYDDSDVITQLKYMPYIEIGIVVAFLIVGMIGFQNIRRSEERYIWVGMAKEAAHQLGTPLSALLGWLEVIVADREETTDLNEHARLVENTVEHMRIDVERLQQVANRFGQIGSIPDLTAHDVNDIVHRVVEYYRLRLPFEGKGIQIEVSAGDCPPVMLNDELFSWALENLLKNGLQAIDSKSGRIQVRTSKATDGRTVIIELQDNGKGISAPAARKIFRPGFTTKKRGWGMGLTLVKRIIEEYHSGKVILKRSRPGETVFEIQLPVSGKRKGKP